MQNEFSFGIGCFHFGLKQEAPFRITLVEYIKYLQEDLGAMSNIANIKIDHMDIDDEEIAVEDKPTISEGPGFFPKPPFLEIEFDIHLPSRVQNDLLKNYQRGDIYKIFSENYKVIIQYTYHFPVTFIIPMEHTIDYDPSLTIIIVREFLKREFKNGKSMNIQFECLGPSPFHVDCYLKKGEHEGQGENWTFYSKVHHQTAYDRITFYYNDNLFKTHQRAFNIIRNHISNELGFYYFVNQTEVVKGTKYLELQDLIDKLISIQRRKGIKGFFTKLFLCSKILNEAFISNSLFQSQEFFIQNIIEKDYRDVVENTPNTSFKFYIDKEIKDKFNYPTNQINQLINLFEARRIKGIEILMFLVSAIIGGAIGSFITSLAK